MCNSLLVFRASASIHEYRYEAFTPRSNAFFFHGGSEGLYASKVHNSSSTSSQDNKHLKGKSFIRSNFSLSLLLIHPKFHPFLLFYFSAYFSALFFVLFVNFDSKLLWRELLVNNLNRVCDQATLFFSMENEFLALFLLLNFSPPEELQTIS
jgi:hypothetical protein